MIPKKQRLEYYWDTDANDDSLLKTCNKFIKDGWIIHQIIPYIGKSYYLLLYKY